MVYSILLRRRKTGTRTQPHWRSRSELSHSHSVCHPAVDVDSKFGSSRGEGSMAKQVPGGGKSGLDCLGTQLHCKFRKWPLFFAPARPLHTHARAAAVLSPMSDRKAARPANPPRHCERQRHSLWDGRRDVHTLAICQLDSVPTWRTRIEQTVSRQPSPAFAETGLDALPCPALPCSALALPSSLPSRLAKQGLTISSSVLFHLSSLSTTNPHTHTHTRPARIRRHNGKEPVQAYPGAAR